MINKEDKNMLTPFQHLNFILNFNDLFFLHNAINGMFSACYHLFLDGHETVVMVTCITFHCFM